MSLPGLYIYCIIRCQRQRTFDIAAMEPGSPVYTLCHQGLAAVVSDSPAKQYENSRHNLITHQQILEKVMAEFPLLPVRFDTVAASPSPWHDVQKLLTRKYQEFDKLLQEIEGRVELGLKAFWREERVIFTELVRENPEINKLQGALSGKPEAATYYSRIHLGEAVKEALERKRAREATALLLPLRPLASRLRENNPLGDRMVLNAAFLVDRARVPQFDQTVNRLDGELGQRLAFKYLGPIPPYNFVNLVVNWKELE